MIENFIDLLLHIVKLQKWKLTLLKIYKYENLNKCWVGKVHFDKGNVEVVMTEGYFLDF